MDRETVEMLSRVSKKLAIAKKNLGDLLDNNKINTKEYDEIRNLLNDCQLEMATYCDCAPIRLMNGEIDVIVTNYNCDAEIDF